MADYDCEYCGKSINNGGKCARFEYNCPFSMVSNYDEKTIHQFQSSFNTILNEIEKMENLDIKGYFDELDYLKSTIKEKQTFISEEILEEWKEMNDDNKKYGMMIVEDENQEQLNMIFCKTIEKMSVFFVDNNSLKENILLEIMKNSDVFENVKINIYPNNGYIDLNIDIIKFPNSKKITFYISKDNLKFYAEDQTSKEEFLKEFGLIEI